MLEIKKLSEMKRSALLNFHDKVDLEKVQVDNLFQESGGGEN